jgi:hypothetical protein
VSARQRSSSASTWSTVCGAWGSRRASAARTRSGSDLISLMSSTSAVSRLALCARYFGAFGRVPIAIWEQGFAPGIRGAFVPENFATNIATKRASSPVTTLAGM